MWVLKYLLSTNDTRKMETQDDEIHKGQENSQGSGEKGQGNTSKSVSDRAEVWGKHVYTWGGIIVHRLQINVCRNQYECLGVRVFPGPLSICCCCHLLCFSWWHEQLQRCQLTVHRQWDFLTFALASSSCLWAPSVQAIPTEYLNYHHFNLELILRL